MARAAPSVVRLGEWEFNVCFLFFVCLWFLYFRFFFIFFIFSFFFFFFQAEDGIRDADVTGVQTCALPISPPRRCYYLVSPPLAWPIRPATPPGFRSRNCLRVLPMSVHGSLPASRRLQS